MLSQWRHADTVPGSVSATDKLLANQLGGRGFTMKSHAIGDSSPAIIAKQEGLDLSWQELAVAKQS